MAQNSMICWENQDKFLKAQAQQIIQLKKQIKSQTQKDSTFKIYAQERIQQMKVQATYLSKRLEQEKAKNAELMIIITVVQQAMQDHKKKQTSLRDDINCESENFLGRKIKKLENQLEQLNTRNNKVSEEVKQKKIKIDICRTQRVIDSGIFRNIERELRSAEFQFKKLLIQKITHQKSYIKIHGEYNSIKGKTKQLYQNINANNTKTMLSEEQAFLNEVPQINYGQNFKFTQITNTQIKNTYIQDKRQDYYRFCQCAVKKLLIQTGVKNYSQLDYFINNIDTVNEDYFVQINKQIDEINKIEKNITCVQFQSNNNKFQFYHGNKELTKESQLQQYKLKLINECQNINKIIESQLVQFKQLQISNNKILNNSLIQFPKLSNNILIDFDQTTLFFQAIENMLIRQFQQFNSADNNNNICNTQNQKLEINEIIAKIKKCDESDKIMNREDFKSEYHRIIRKKTNIPLRMNCKRISDTIQII